MPNQPEIWVPTTLLGALSPVCASCGEILIVPPPLVSTSLFTRKFWIHSACHCPLRNRMVEYDLSTSTSCVLNHDLQAFSQRSHALLCTSVCLTLFNCCHSCWQSKSSCFSVHHSAQALFALFCCFVQRR